MNKRDLPAGNVSRDALSNSVSCPGVLYRNFLNKRTNHTESDQLAT
jgi:hypothetical protein